MSEISNKAFVPNSVPGGGIRQAWHITRNGWIRLTKPLTRTIPRNTLNFLGLILAVYIFPFTVLALIHLPVPLRHFIAGLTVTCVAVYALVKKYSWHELGFRRDNLIPALVMCSIVSLPFGLMAYLTSSQEWVREFNRPAYGIVLTIFYLFVSAPGQEFLYRSFLFAQMKRMGFHNSKLQILISALTFSYLHIQHHDPLTLAFTFGIGTLWATIYQKYPNFWAVSISHALLGYLAICVKLV